MKKVLVLMLLGFFSAQVAMGSLRWGSGINVITDYNGDPVETSDSFDPTAGAFAQLIRVLNGTTPYAFTGVGSGIDTANEAVMGVVYSGLNNDLSDPGTFAFPLVYSFGSSDYNGTYYVRVFDAPQASVAAWNQGTNAPIPAAAAYYFQSETLAYTHNELSPQTWNFGEGQTLNPIAIPEPTTMLLMVGGFAGVMAIRRKRA